MEFLKKLSFKNLFPSHDEQVKQTPTTKSAVASVPVAGPSSSEAASNEFIGPACADYEDYMVASIFDIPKC